MEPTPGVRRALVTHAILTGLQELGGRADRADVLDRATQLAGFTGNEMSPNKTGEARHMVALQRGASRLASAGWIRRERGPWSITDAGIRALESLDVDALHVEMNRLDAVARGVRAG